MSTVDYHKGLGDLGQGCHAWFQPDGGWGLSNAGLIIGSGTSLMVDTLIDLPLTREMLAGIAPVTDAHPIETLVNTHSDGDHVNGNQLLADRDVEIVSSEAAAALITPEAAGMVSSLDDIPGPAAAFVRHTMGGFDLSGIVATPPTRTFSGELSVDVGGREVQLIQVGPAHTAGDALVHVPDAKTLYAGDVLFIGGTPIAWAGPIERWIKVCEQILEMDLVTIVPGHGPMCGKAEVREMRDYLSFVDREARKRFEDGLSVEEAIDSIDLGEYAAVPEHGRIAQNVANVYSHLDPARPAPDLMTIMTRIATLEGFAAPPVAEATKPERMRS